MSRVRSTFRACRHCGTRVLYVSATVPGRRMPALNWDPDPAGKVAVTIASPRTGRFLAEDEEPDRMEKRYSVHECDGRRRQRGQWTSAQRGEKPRRTRSWREPKTQMATLPGMTRST